jgi:hypothetical protein
MLLKLLQLGRQGEVNACQLVDDCPAFHCDGRRGLNYKFGLIYLIPFSVGTAC